MSAVQRPHGLDVRTAILLTLPTTLWAGNAVVGRLIAGQFPPIALNWARWLSALAVLLPFVLLRARQRGAWPSASWRVMVPLGLLGVGAYNALQYMALQTSTAVNATLIGASMPAWILGVGAVFFRAKVTGRQWLGAAVSITGVLCVLAQGDPARLASFTLVPGDLYMLLATMSWSFYTWLLRRKRPNLPGLDFLALQIVYGVVLSAPIVGVESALSPITMHWTPTVLMALAYIAIGPSIVAYACWDYGVARAGATVPVFFVNLTPLFATLLSAAVLGEMPHLYHGVAFMLILAGIVLAMGRLPGRQS